MPSNTSSKNLKFLKTAYFPNFLKNGVKLMDALCSLVADLQMDRDATVNRFLEHAGSEDFIWAILKLLGFQNEKIAGNAAYVIGTLADTNAGSERLISLVGKSSEVGDRILTDLMRLLGLADDEIVLNGVGALGSLADSEHGRQWLCNAVQFNELLEKICSLVRHKNIWIGSNSALLLARLTIFDVGLSQMLVHPNAREICINLVLSLGSDAAGRGMNAAFALGRVVDVSGGQELISVLDEDLHRIMVKQLAKMFEDRDVGTAKNALYALSCLAGQKSGSNILARNRVIEQIAKHLCDLLINEMADNELRWFCAMTLRSFACQQKTCLELKRLHFVYNSCKAALRMPTLSEDIKDEITDVFEYLKPLPQMPPPRLELTGPLTIKIEWDEMKLHGPFQPRYGLYHNLEHNEPTFIYGGSNLSFVLTDQKPYTLHSFRIRLVTDHEEGPLSDAITIRTEEWLPGQVRNLHMIGNTASQIKVAWDEPLEPNGVIRGYTIYLDDNPNRVGRTDENYFILQNLNQTAIQDKDKSTYVVHVAAVSGRGEGVRHSLEVSTAEVGESRPSKPIVTVLGRSELYVTWNAPPNAPGKIIRYELLANNEIVYSGTELHATITRLQPDTEYSFQVVMFSNEGRFLSYVTKKTTPRDEFVAFNGPRTSSSKSRRSVRKSSAAEVQTDDEPILLECVPPAPPAPAVVIEPPDLGGKPPTPPPKPFRRSKTMASSGGKRRSASIRRLAQLSSRRRIPPIQRDLLSSTQSLPGAQQKQEKENSNLQKGNLHGESNCVIKRERSSTTGSKGSDIPAIKEAVANVRQRRDRSLSMVHKLLAAGVGKPNDIANNKTDVKSPNVDIRCSVVTLNLPNGVPSAFDFSSRWAYGITAHKLEMISANQPPMSADSTIVNKRSRSPFVPDPRRLPPPGASVAQSYIGNTVYHVGPGALAFNQRSFTTMLAETAAHGRERAHTPGQTNNSVNEGPPGSRSSERGAMPAELTHHPAFGLPPSQLPPRLYMMQKHHKQSKLLHNHHNIAAVVPTTQQQSQQSPVIN